MYEYKVLTVSAAYMQDSLNREARQGWRVVSSHYEPEKNGMFPYSVVLMEREITGGYVGD